MLRSSSEETVNIVSFADVDIIDTERDWRKGRASVSIHIAYIHITGWWYIQIKNM